MTDFWPVIIIVVLADALLVSLGQKLIERFLGRRPIPENRIFHAGAFTVVGGTMILVFARLAPNASPVLWTVVMLSAFTFGEFIAQSLFGRRAA
jgi:hypothetical protein